MGTNLEVILTQSVEGLGQPGDVVRVSTGYARNFLIPRELGVAATPKNMRRYEAQLRARRHVEAKTLGDAQDVARQLEGTVCIVASNAGESGRLFGSVTAGDVADVLATKGFAVDRRRIELEGGIRELGVHEVAIRLHSDVTVPLQVEVIRSEPDEQTEQDDDAAS